MSLDQVDALARLALRARREGWDLRIDDPPAQLVELLTLCGLRDVLLSAEPELDLPRVDRLPARPVDELEPGG